ncbi:l-gluamine-d-fructose-6-phosphate aminotransferase [Salmonella phage 40]|nr:l-gluamine-d-fructose-6-phosphate aminotransferase [Salmonella phage 40]
MGFFAFSLAKTGVVVRENAQAVARIIAFIFKSCSKLKSPKKGAIN